MDLSPTLADKLADEEELDEDNFVVNFMGICCLISGFSTPCLTSLVVLKRFKLAIESFLREPPEANDCSWLEDEP